MSTEGQTAGTNVNDTGVPAPAAPAAAAPAAAAPAAAAPAAPPGEGAPAAAPAPGDDTGTPPKEGAEGTPPKEGAPAPGEYEDFALPEGTTLNTEIMSEFTTLAKELEIPQEKAQQFVDLGAKAVQTVQQQFVDHVTTEQNKWVEASRTDKEFGGDNIQQNLAVAKKAMDAFASPELAQLLKESKLGNHPEIIRTFYRVGLKMSEDSLIPGGKKPDGVGAPPEKVFYPTMN